MEPIQKIDIPNITIPQFGTNEVWLNDVPFIPSNHPSVTTQIGFPIVEMPGCVKMHQDNKDHVTRMPFDHDLVNQDEDGVTTLCPHGEYPSYDAMDYQPEQLMEMMNSLLELNSKVAWVSMVGCLVGYTLAMMMYHSTKK